MPRLGHPLAPHLPPHLRMPQKGLRPQGRSDAGSRVTLTTSIPNPDIKRVPWVGDDALLWCICYVFKFEIVVKNIDACVDKSHVGREFHVGRIEHVGEQGEVVVVTVFDYRVVLGGKFHLLLLRLHLYRAGQQIGVVSLHRIIDAFASQLHALACLGILVTCLADVVLVLPNA